MLKRLLIPIAAAAILCAGLLFPSACAGESNMDPEAANPNRQDVRTAKVNPFTRLAYIPADADLNTIRLAKVKLINVPSRITFSTDSSYCQGLTFRDPGGSNFCPNAQNASLVPAYEVTYSLTGQPVASDEYGDPNMSFRVLFRPDELPPDAQQALSVKKLNRSDAAAYFEVKTYREFVKRVVIDDKESQFCEGNFAESMWTQKDPDCKDDIHYTAVTVPSEYIAVRVDPVAQPVARAAVAARK